MGVRFPPGAPGALSSVGRAPRLHRDGRKFESCSAHQMETKKILEVIDRYQKLLDEWNVPKVRMNPSCTMGSLTREEALAHANYLLEGIRVFAQTPGKEDKTGRHLASVQMILSFLDVYTLNELMDHNRPDSE